MVKVKLVIWRTLTIFTVGIFLWLSFSIGLIDLLKFPYQLYVMRWRDFYSPNSLIDYWGTKKFTPELWKNKTDRAPQAIELFVSKRLIGMTRNEAEQLLGKPDGDYVLSDSNLTYEIIDHTSNSDLPQGARWSLVLLMTDNKVSKIRIYKSCCQNN